VDTELSRLRTDMQTGDTQLAARVDQNAQRVAALETAVQQMRTEFGAQIEELKGEFAGMVVFNLPVHFEFDRSELREADRPVLEKFAAVVKEYYPGALITVEGFTDPAGSVSYNQRLGQSRASEVMEFLTTQGMSAEMMRGVSYGEARNRQVAPGMAGDRPGAEANRRVTFVVDSRPTGTTTT
jgi:peptidoglycan-associated lipoprotein